MNKIFGNIMCWELNNNHSSHQKQLEIKYFMEGACTKREITPKSN
jgi:hypothetical protein